jgi:hypothetical protein
MRNILFMGHQHGGDDVTWKPRIAFWNFLTNFTIFLAHGFERFWFVFRSLILMQKQKFEFFFILEHLLFNSLDSWYITELYIRRWTCFLIWVNNRIPWHIQTTCLNHLFACHSALNYKTKSFGHIMRAFTNC